MSASTRNAIDVLEAVLPVIGKHRSAFKVARDRLTLAQLNEGWFGPTQIGKFLTLYPRNEGEALAVAKQLVAATSGMSGPRVPSDRRLVPDAPVYYRYGAFRGRWRETPLGDVEDVLERPDGTLVADRRRRVAVLPDWVVDPFEAAGMRVSPPPTLLSVADRYLIVKSLSPATVVTIYLTVDTSAGRRAVLKRIPLETGTDVTPEGVIASLEHEREAMERLEPSGIFPRPWDVFVDGDHAFLAMEHLDGVPLDTWIDDRVGDRGRCDTDEVCRVLGSLADALVAIHELGYVYADLKSEHVIVGDDLSVRMLDTETMLHADEPFVKPMRTGGYASPEQWRGERPEPADDVHAFGAIVYEALTGTRAFDAPQRHHLLVRPLRAMAPAAPQHLVALAESCLARTRADRPPSTGLRALVASRTRVEVARPVPPPPRDAWPSVLARVLAETQREAGKAWWTFPDDAGPTCRYLGNGVAGVAYSLCELAPLANDIDAEAIHEVVGAAARWLSSQRPLRATPIGGLYVGESGIGVSLMSIGERLARPDLVADGLARIRQTAGRELESPDLFNGVAGRLRAHLWAWRVSGAAIDLDHAADDIRRLLSMRAVSADGTHIWRYPDDHAGLSGRHHLGYAHGAAGIADALLDAVAVFSAADSCSSLSSSARQVVEGVVRHLAATARSGPPDGGVHWTAHADDDLTSAYWCHGTTGVARFLVRCHRARIDAGADVIGLIRGGCRTIASQTHLGASQCHGLAGSVELLSDAHALLGDDTFAADARRLASLLMPFTGPAEEGVDDEWSPALMTGATGLARAMARADRPGVLPTLLSPFDDLLDGLR